VPDCTTVPFDGGWPRQAEKPRGRRPAPGTARRARDGPAPRRWTGTDSPGRLLGEAGRRLRRIPRSSFGTRTSRRLRANSARSAVVSRPRRPASIPVWRSHRRGVTGWIPRSRTVWATERSSVCARRTASSREAGGRPGGGSATSLALHVVRGLAFGDDASQSVGCSRNRSNPTPDMPSVRIRPGPRSPDPRSSQLAEACEVPHRPCEHRGRVAGGRRALLRASHQHTVSRTQGAPLAVGTYHIGESVQDLSHRALPQSAPRLGRRQMRFETGELGVGQVGGIGVAWHAPARPTTAARSRRPFSRRL
jgi:hypothetical protein